MIKHILKEAFCWNHKEILEIIYLEYFEVQVLSMIAHIWYLQHIEYNIEKEWKVQKSKTGKPDTKRVKVDIKNSLIKNESK